jgi:DNA-binding transcriptional ArsR family regulator
MTASDTFETGLLKALGHPLRFRMLASITERGEASPTELAREFGHPLATVSHHTRVLRDLGWIELARTEPRRGAVEHFYRAARRPFLDDDEWEQLPVPMRRGLAGLTLRQIFADAARAGGNGGFDEPGACVARMPLELDERGWWELADALRDLLREADHIQRRADARAARQTGPQATVRASSLAILHYSGGQAHTTLELAERDGWPAPPRPPLR